MDRLAIYYESEAYSFSKSPKGGIMGRQAAGNSFFRAIAASSLKQVWCYSRSKELSDECGEQLSIAGGGGINVDWIDFAQTRNLQAAGMLYRPDPGIVSDSWRRLCYATPRAYSLCGITHTTATTNVMGVITGMLTAPLEDWDAIICTSHSVRDSMRGMIEEEANYLRERVGATRLTVPQLPVIPLGVHCDDFASRESKRDSARASLGIATADVVFLFVGRLTFLEKAHPIAMYLALEACAKAMPGTRITLIQAGWSPSSQFGEIFAKEAEILCPSVRVIFVDGRKADEKDAAWAAADVFTSLPDNIQETFGLTPVEAMAAGLPVVVSDWNGYKDTVRHGLDGIRIPTLTMPPGSGRALSDRLDMQTSTYGIYCGLAAQFTAVDVDAAASAYIRLARDPALRHKLGESGRAHARRNFDWRIIFQRYMDLWTELGERRRSGASLYPPLTRRRRPDRPDPFSMFANYPSAMLGPHVVFRLAPGGDADTAIAHRALKSIGFAVGALPSDETIRATIASVEADSWSTLDAIVARGLVERGRVESCLIWLCKVGILQFRLVKA